MKLVDVVGIVSKTSNTGSVEQQEFSVTTTIIDGPVGEVSFETGFTLNLGNYQSARIHVGIKVPSNLDADSLDKSYAFVKNWVDVKLSAAIKEAKESMK
jgi:hypothetical protein